MLNWVKWSLFQTQGRAVMCPELWLELQLSTNLQRQNCSHRGCCITHGRGDTATTSDSSVEPREQIWLWPKMARKYAIHRGHRAVLTIGHKCQNRPHENVLLCWKPDTVYELISYRKSSHCSFKPSSLRVCGSDFYKYQSECQIVMHVPSTHTVSNWSFLVWVLNGYKAASLQTLLNSKLSAVPLVSKSFLGWHKSKSNSLKQKKSINTCM